MISQKVLPIINDHPTLTDGLSATGYFCLLGRDFKKPAMASTSECRESTASYYHSCKLNKTPAHAMCLSIKERHIEALDEWWQMIEGRLGLEPQSTLYITDNKHQIIIEPHPFWLADIVKFHALTLLFRAGAFYWPNKDYGNKDYEKTMGSYSYTANTRMAVERFLDGNTHYTEGMNLFAGWVATFNGKPKESINRLLVKPTKEQAALYEVKQEDTKETKK